LKGNNKKNYRLLFKIFRKHFDAVVNGREEFYQILLLRKKQEVNGKQKISITKT